MKNRLLLAALLVAFLVSDAWAGSPTPVAPATNAPVGVNSKTLNMGGLIEGDLANGHVYYAGFSPTAQCDAGSPSLDAKATDTSGTLTGGAGSVSCTVTFAHAYASFNHCVVSSESALASFAYSYSLTAITITATTIGTAKVDYHCDGA